MLSLDIPHIWGISIFLTILGKKVLVFPAAEEGGGVRSRYVRVNGREGG